MSGLARRLARQRHGMREAAGEPLAIESQHFAVMISSPMQDMCHTQFCIALVNMFAYTALNSPPSLTIGFQQFGTSILQYSREALAKKALEHGATHMLWLDSDMEFPPDTLIRLLRHGKPFVAANCLARRPPFQITARDDANREIPTTAESTGIEKCSRVGLAVALTSMEMFKTLPEPWFDFEWVPDSNYEVIRGEDVRFCHNARAAGYELYIDHDLSKQVNHIGTFAYNPMVAPFLRTPTSQEITK